MKSEHCSIRNIFLFQDYRIRPYKAIDFTVDKAGGRQYTSFEGNRKENENRIPLKPLTPPPVCFNNFKKLLSIIILRKI